MTEQIKKLRDLLLDLPGNYFTFALFSIVDALDDVGDGDASECYGNVGIHVVGNAIELVDIEAGTNIATFTLTINPSF